MIKIDEQWVLGFLDGCLEAIGRICTIVAALLIYHLIVSYSTIFTPLKELTW